MHHGIAALASLMPVSHNNLSFDFKIKRGLGGVQYPAPYWNAAWLGAIAPGELSRCFGGPVDLEAVYSEAIEVWDSCRQKTLLDRTLQFYTEIYMQDGILAKVDRATMMHGLEARSPFLDIEVANFARRLPNRFKLRDGVTKYLLKKALEPLLPADIIYRKKKGFGTPMSAWFHTGKLTITEPSHFAQSKAVAHLNRKSDERSFSGASTPPSNGGLVVNRAALSRESPRSLLRIPTRGRRRRTSGRPGRHRPRRTGTRGARANLRHAPPASQRGTRRCTHRTRRVLPQKRGHVQRTGDGALPRHQLPASPEDRPRVETRCNPRAFRRSTGVLAASISALTRIPYVLTAHLGDVPGGVPEQTSHLFKMVDPFARIIWKRAAATTAVSSYVGALARAAYSADPHVILNGIAAPANTGGPKISNKLLMVGRLSVQKNPLLAIESLALVRDLPWTLDVIGDGPLRAPMEELARQNSMADRITFRGWLDARDVHAAMAEAEMLFIPSLHEGLPMAAIEALHHGLVIVGSNIGGLADVLSDDENGFMCPLEAPAFAERLRQLLISPETKSRMSQCSRGLAANFGVDRSVDGYEKVLRAVTGEKE